MDYMSQIRLPVAPTADEHIVRQSDLDVRDQFVTTSTAATVPGKTAVKQGFRLVVGARLFVLFTYGNTATSPTLNVGDGNGDTGARPIYYRGVSVAPGLIAAGGIYQMVYDGALWNIVGDLHGGGPVLDGGTF
jgi:hypothetical protein